MDKLSNTTQDTERIQNYITKDSSSYTVNFKGVDTKIAITKKELQDAKRPNQNKQKPEIGNDIQSFIYILIKQ